MALSSANVNVRAGTFGMSLCWRAMQQGNFGNLHNAEGGVVVGWPDLIQRAEETGEIKGPRLNFVFREALFPAGVSLSQSLTPLFTRILNDPVGIVAYSYAIVNWPLVRQLVHSPSGLGWTDVYSITVALILAPMLFPATVRAIVDHPTETDAFVLWWQYYAPPQYSTPPPEGYAAVVDADVIKCPRAKLNVGVN